MKRSCAGLVLWSAIVATACSDPEHCPGGTWVDTDGGGACVIATPDAGLDTSADPTCLLSGRSNLPSTRFDGLHMRLGPATVLGESYYSSSGTDLVARDGRLWWSETNDRCGTTGTMIWWGVQTFRFRGDAEGRALDLEASCEPWTYAATNARLLPCGDGLALCTQGHHPYRYVSCGRLGSVPGGLEPLDDLESPRRFIAGERSRGVILRWQHDETGEQGIRLYGTDGALESTLDLPTTDGPEGLWVTELAEVPLLAKAGSAGTPLVIDRIGPGTTVLPSIQIEGFPTDRELIPSTVLARDGDARVATFLYEPTGSDARIHLVVVGSDGSWGSRPVLARVTRVTGAAYDARGHLIVLTERLEEATMMAHAELWRLGCDGTLLEEPLAVEAAVDMHPRALGIEPDASRAWIAFSVHDADDVQPGNVRPHYVHSVRSVLLP